MAQAAFRRTAPGREAGWIRATWLLAPVSFVIATLILYWATWQELRIALPVLLIGALVYGVQQVRAGVDWHDVQVGGWLVGYLVAILLLSGLGSFGGTGLIPAPWDSVIVAAIGLAGFVLGVRSALRHLAVHPAPEPAPARRPPPPSRNPARRRGAPAPGQAG